MTKPIELFPHQERILKQLADRGSIVLDIHYPKGLSKCNTGGDMRNINKDPIKVKHSELQRCSDGTKYRSYCPVCKQGILFLYRSDDLLLKEGDRCLQCGQRFTYTDIAELRAAERGEIMDTPGNIEDCFPEVEKILRDTDDFGITEFKDTPEKDMIVLYHHNLGRHLRNEWGLWRGSKLRDWFVEKGITHADDMSNIILTSFHRFLNGKEINLEDQISHKIAYWEKGGNNYATE